jgi:NADH-ubiquinone oxidoreductase chain 2
MCLDYFKEKSLNVFESIVLILFSTCNMFLMISTYDLIAMYLTIELQSLCFYVIATLKKDSEFSTEANFKYFILGAFFFGILLFGCSMFYGFIGVTNFEELAKIFTRYKIILFGAQFSGIFMGI